MSTCAALQSAEGVVAFGPYASRVSEGILIVDDHAEFRTQARALLEAGGYRIVGEAEDAAGAIEAVRDLRPRILLLDVQLPDGDGFSVADAIGTGDDAPRIVFVSTREASDYGTRLERADSAGFIHKPDLSLTAIARLVGPPT